MRVDSGKMVIVLLKIHFSAVRFNGHGSNNTVIIKLLFIIN